MEQLRFAPHKNTLRTKVLRVSNSSRGANARDPFLNPKLKKKCNKDLANKEAEPKTILLRQGVSEE